VGVRWLPWFTAWFCLLNLAVKLLKGLHASRLSPRECKVQGAALPLLGDEIHSKIERSSSPSHLLVADSVGTPVSYSFS
jgi:hypothetical protein